MPRNDYVSVTSEVEVSGPFFTRDPRKTFYANLRDMLDKLAAEMETQVKAEISGHEAAMPYWTGYSRDHVVGYTTSKETGKRWSTWAAVGSVTAGMDKKEAIRTKASAATIEARFHPYRNVKRNVYRMRALLTADLTKGLE